jgi:PilZ domain
MSEQIVSFRTSNSRIGAKGDRRAWVRFPTNQAVRCQPMTGAIARAPEIDWSGKAIDISAGGIALSLGVQVEPGTALSVELSSNSEKLRFLFARVVHATQEISGSWILGCSFTWPLSDEELQTCFEEWPL